MYITVIPTSHSISTTPLTYHVGDVFHTQIQIGSLIEIPLGKNIEYGIIASLESPIPEHQEIKSIVQVICSSPIIAPYQVETIIHIAKHYMIPIHRVLGFFLPRPVLSRLEKSNYADLNEIKGNQKNPSSHLYFFQNTTLNSQILEPYLKPMSIIVCPDDISLSQYQKAFHDKEWAIFLPNEATDARRSKAWRDVRNGVYPYVFSTRKILFFNLESYSQILYLEDAFSSEYFHYPTYIHYNDVLKFIDKTQTFSINILSSIPLIRTLSDFRHFPIENIF